MEHLPRAQPRWHPQVRRNAGIAAARAQPFSLGVGVPRSACRAPRPGVNAATEQSIPTRRAITTSAIKHGPRLARLLRSRPRRSASTVALLATGSTLPRTVALSDEVRSRVGMPGWAMGAQHLRGRKRASAPQVLAARGRGEMRGVDAATMRAGPTASTRRVAVVALVVDIEARRDRPDEHFVDPSVGVNRLRA